MKCFPRLLPGAIKKSMTGVIKIWQCGLSRTSPNLPIIRRLKSSKRALGYNFEVPKQNWLWDFLLKRDARLRKLNHQDTETQRRLIKTPCFPVLTIPPGDRGSRGEHFSTQFVSPLKTKMEKIMKKYLLMLVIMALALSACSAQSTPQNMSQGT